MSTNVKARAHFQVLKELGVLMSAEAAPCLDPAETQSPAPSHVFSGHTPLWAYEHPFFARPVLTAPPVFETLDPASSLEEVLAKTRFVAVVGAELSPVVERLLAEQGVLLLLFEHDSRRLARFLAQVDPARLTNKAFVFLGRPHGFTPPLSGLLTRESFRFGFPVFYVPEGSASPEIDAAFAGEITEYVENLFFRERVYPLSSQSLSRSIPFRKIAQDLFLDQLVHAYENIPAYALCPDTDALRGLFRGETAILAAAGAALAEQYDFLRANQDRAVIIAVNSALKPLVAAGVRPHFCVVNDTSLQVAKAFEDLPLQRSVMLVAHSLSSLGGEVFPKKFLFGSVRPDVFGARPSLRLHGSVLTTAFSLARHLGCARVVLAGALLSSGDPRSLNYVSGESGLGTVSEAALQRTNGWPQLYPVVNRFGRKRYTSLNFLDVKHWLAEEIRLSGLPVVNTSRDSILDTPPVEFEETPDIESTGRLPQALRQAFAARRRAPAALAKAMAFVQTEAARHKGCLHLLDSLENLGPEAFLQQGQKVLAVFDANNVSYLVQRFEDYNNAQFYVMITSRDPAEVAKGLRYHFTYVRAMLQFLVALLARQEAELRQMAKTA